MQVCHGQGAPLRRLRPGDVVGGFVPFRHDVRDLAAEPAPIAPQLDALGLSPVGMTAQ